MLFKIPQTPFQLMTACYLKIFPKVNRELKYWKRRAEEIENKELRAQALSSIETKTFHCEGGGIYALLAKSRKKEAIRFIVAYQTISDYLDNLCDRSTSLDPEDFTCLHQSMLDALTPGKTVSNYYAFRVDQEDNGYLKDLVLTCQQTLAGISDYESIQPYLLELAKLYSDLQVHKHVKQEERITRLTNWFHLHREKCPDLTWYEFSACTGSTLGIFCLVSYGLEGHSSLEFGEMIYKSYFPYMQGLHIMLDYFIDQMEDEVEGDLNFCSFYPDIEQLEQRFLYLMNQTKKYLHSVPHEGFHHLVQKGLVGMYLADQKVKRMKQSKEVIKSLLKEAGYKAKFFYFNAKLYTKVKTYVK